MKFHINNNNKKIITGLVLSSLVFSMGYYAGARQSTTYAENGKIQSATLGEVKKYLDEKFINWKASSTPPTEKELQYGLIQGYVGAYKDPYTIFFPPREAKSFQETVKGSFGGVGMTVGEKEGRAVVIAPLKDSPAMKAGIKAGDFIVKVDGKDTSGHSSDEAVSMIRGEIGKEVTITVVRKDEPKPLDIKIVREEIKIPTLDTETKDGVFIVRLYNFSQESPELFKKAMDDFLKSGTQYLVLDLRGNPGGYLEAAVQMASFFLPAGKDIVVEKKGMAKDGTTSHKSYGYNAFNANLRMAILLDEGSASASEILAGALKDYNVAKIFGTKSFGKGSVQELINLKDGSSLKVTVAKWYTPNGVSISEHGIVPDYPVALDVAAFKKDKTDTQLNKAIKGLKDPASLLIPDATSTIQ